MPGPLDFTEAPWVATGVTADSLGMLTEDLTSNRHSVHQDVQALVDAGLGTDVIYRARVRPVGRTKCWIGCRQNNNFWMASFDLTGPGQVLTVGSNVSSASIVDNGDGSYMCRVNYSGTFSTTATVFAVGALIDDATQTYTGTGIAAIEVTEAQMIKGTNPVAYEATTDREAYLDEAIADGFQHAVMPALNRPGTLEPGYIVCAGSDPLQVDDLAYDLDALTVAVVCSWDGTTGAEKSLAEHWDVPDGDPDPAWKMVLTSAGKLQVHLSSNGVSAAKIYTAVRALDVDTKTLCAFTWDGTSLRLYYNDVELTVASSELTKDTDGALSGNLNDSLANILQWKSHRGRGYEFRLFSGAATPSEVASIASELSLSGLPTGGGGSPADPFPTTLAGMVTWLEDHGVLAANIRYVDNLIGNDANSGLTTGAPWATIQKAANTLVAGQAVIIRGRNGRFYEQVTIGASGGAGNRIWYVSDPENPTIMDASESFSQTWTDQGSSRWRAPYGQTRPYSASASYYSTCTTGNCVDDHVWMSHQLIHNDVQLKRVNQATVPASLAEGQCYFEVGTGSNEAPQYVWCRLPGSVNPNGQAMRIGSNKTKLFDYSPHTWLGFPGGTSGQEDDGRDYIGLVNVHFRFGCNIRKVSMAAVRGTGWHVERCSFEESNSIGLTIHGTGHYIYNCKTHRNGQMGFHLTYLEGSEIQRCFITANNFHFYPPSWEAGGLKISDCGKTSRVEIHECLIAENDGVGMWWDIDNGKDNPSQDSFFVHHCYFRSNLKGQAMYERVSRYILTEDCVVWNGRADDEGQSANMIGPGLRTQAANLNTFRRVVVVYNAGKGWLYKADDSRGPANEDTVDRCAFIQNARQTDIDQERVEYQGGDDTVYSKLWSTSTITNVLLSNNIAGVNLFHRRTPTPAVLTDNLATFAGWNGATGTIDVADPATVVNDYTDERGCYEFLPAYSAWAPIGFTHPDDYPTNWVTPS